MPCVIHKVALIGAAGFFDLSSSEKLEVITELKVIGQMCLQNVAEGLRVMMFCFMLLKL